MSQFLGYQEDRIVLVSNNKKDLEENKAIIFDKIVEYTGKDKYINVNGKYILESALRNEKIIEARKATYPSIEEQLDMLYWDKVNGTNIWKDTISKIKKLYPKK